MDLLLEEGIDLDRGHEWHRAKLFEIENRAFFVPKYEETRIDFTIPMK
jgi:hypothetical protein